MRDVISNQVKISIEYDRLIRIVSTAMKENVQHYQTMQNE